MAKEQSVTKGEKLCSKWGIKYPLQKDFLRNESEGFGAAEC